MKKAITRKRASTPRKKSVNSKKGKKGSGIGGVKRKRKSTTTTTGKSHVKSFKQGLAAAKLAVKKAVKSGNVGLKSVSKLGLLAARKHINRSTGKNYVPRVLPVPQRGGFLPILLPIFAALSALGSLAGGAAGVAAAVNKAKDARKLYEEGKRHNETMEALAIKGSGMYLQPYKKGLGLYLNPPSPKNS